jgi:hypothetical protein
VPASARAYDKGVIRISGRQIEGSANNPGAASTIVADRSRAGQFLPGRPGPSQEGMRDDYPAS